MTNAHRTQPPPLPTAPPPPPQAEDPRPRRGGYVFGFLLGILTWLMAFAALSTAEDSENPTMGYTMAIGLTIVGATFLLAAVLYDIAARRDT